MAAIGTSGSNHKFFCFDEETYISWDEIRKAPVIYWSLEGLDEATRSEVWSFEIGTDFSLSIRVIWSSATRREMMQRLMGELRIVVAAEKDVSVPDRLTKVEEMVNHIWYKPGGPGYDHAHESFNGKVRLQTILDDEFNNALCEAGGKP